MSRAEISVSAGYINRTDCDTTVHRHCFGPWIVGYSQKLCLRRSAFCYGALYFCYISNAITFTATSFVMPSTGLVSTT